MKKRNSDSLHEFAIYYPLLPVKSAIGDEIQISDKDVCHRIERVLRLKKDEELVLFNRSHHTKLRILELKRSSISCEVLSHAANHIISPSITFLLPILKKDALSDAVYYLVEAGVNRIQLVHTTKGQRKWGGQKELDRLERVAIAAAEQSKNFAFPEIAAPIMLTESLSLVSKDAWHFYGDPEGQSVQTVFNQPTPSTIFLICGPEGDFTVDEKEELRGASFQPLQLTPTILRAETAAFCISTLFRTVFS